jgi:hypothetical protein
MMTTFYKLTKRLNGQFRAAHVEVAGDKIVAANPAMTFSIGWPFDHLKGQAEKYGFKMTHMPLLRRTANYLTERPTIEQRKAFRNKEPA